MEADTAVFACFNCNLNLTGYRYILRDEKPFCIKCYESLFANACEDCKTPIGTDSKVSTAFAYFTTVLSGYIWLLWISL